jgi:biopolymer transport protein ExbD
MFQAGISARATRSNADAGAFRPQLTSLVDVMTILLVFLIKSFSVEGTLVTPSPDLQLPVSTSKKPPRPTCALEITRDAVMAEGNVLAKIDAFAASDTLVIPLLFDWMQVQQQKCRDTSKFREVLIQADRATEFNVIKRVMFTCSKAGFTDYSVLVLGED